MRQTTSVEQVERAGGDHHVVDLAQLGEPVGDRLEVARGPYADHGLAGEAELERVGDRDDLHHAGVEQPLHPLADRRLGQPDRLADRRVRPPAVLLELLDDLLGHVVEQGVAAPSRTVTRRAGGPWPGPIGRCSARDVAIRLP